MRIGTRARALALAQARGVVERIAGAELVPISSPVEAHAPGDKSRFVAGLEQALQRGEIDAAVHSAKDVPGTLASGLELVAAPARAAVEDVLCGASAIEELAAGARVGTSSPRRAAQLRAAREDLEVAELRGNVDTRLRKLADGEADALVLARAGLQRLGREDAIGAVLDPARFVPAPGQGTLVLEARAGDTRAREALAPLGDADTFACLLVERALAAALDASCELPLGALATVAAGGLRLRAWVGAADGSAWIRDELLGERAEPEALGQELARRMRLVGADEVLYGAGDGRRAGRIT
ncbi:MAG TPA: hydroxymethylbilane synthase [Solirubrobacteraceae bacterium]|nr:hydroxymethylbilane synthase [Solirubrobacteraceae bacterium]